MAKRTHFDLEPLQGTWDIVELEVDGATMPFAARAGARIVISGNRFVSLGMGAEYTGELTGDDAVFPHTLDIRFTEGVHSGKASLALYEMDGDSLRICLCLAGGTRPAEFKTTRGSGHVLEVLRRRAAGEEPMQAPSAMPNELSAIVCNEDDPDLQLVTGIWKMKSCIRGGEPLPRQVLSYGKRSATTTEVIVSFGGDVIIRARYALNSAASPKSMDYLLLEGPQAGARQCGIYRLDRDELTTFMSSPGGERPLNFQTADGDGRTLAEWVRSS